MKTLDLALANLGPDRVGRLLQRHGTVDAVVRALGLSKGDSVALAAAGVGFVTNRDPGYPDALAGLPDAPGWLFVRGAIPTTDAVAVVGSRRATRYGLELAESIGWRLAAAGRPVISGLAAGIDGAAHRGCLDGGGTAVAVLGSGIDVWYPSRHRSLGERILGSGGAVISEFGPGAAPEPWRFPTRNRIIAGLSRIVVVVEAAERSGALITARLAVDQGREVFAVPGDIDRTTSRGCNLLIRDGAHPVTDIDALIEMVEFVLGPSPGADHLSIAGERIGIPELFGVRLEVPRSLNDVVETAGRPVQETLAELAAMEATGVVSLIGGVVTPQFSYGQNRAAL